MNDFGSIQNPGSAIGESVGAHMEIALNRFMREIADILGYHYLNQSPHPGRKKLLLKDSFDNEYNIDAVLADAALHPIILFEWKYIRYTKHNRDKASWICNTHAALRRKYTSARSSIAVLAGNWSLPSLAMLRSYDITLFLIPFQEMKSVLAGFSVDFGWDEKDRASAISAWAAYSQLSDSQKTEIGNLLIAGIKPGLEDRILSIVDDTRPRSIEHVTIELKTNLGEVHRQQFASLEDAIVTFDRLQSGELALEDLFNADGSPTLLD